MEGIVPTLVNILIMYVSFLEEEFTSYFTCSLTSGVGRKHLVQSRQSIRSTTTFNWVAPRLINPFSCLDWPISSGFFVEFQLPRLLKLRPWNSAQCRIGKSRKLWNIANIRFQRNSISFKITLQTRKSHPQPSTCFRGCEPCRRAGSRTLWGRSRPGSGGGRCGAPVLYKYSLTSICY